MTTAQTTSHRLLYAIPEPFPTHRADIIALFGSYLPRQGVYSDLVAYTEEHETNSLSAKWPAGKLITRTIRGGNIKVRVLSFLFILGSLCRASRSNYDAIQVRDMPVIATLAFFIARFKRLPFFYWMSYPIPEGQIDYAKQRGLSSGVLKYLYPLVSGYIGRFLLNHFVTRVADHLFVQSDVMKQEQMAKGIPEQKLTPVPMGVDLELIANYTPEKSDVLPLKGKSPILVYLGILERARQLWVLFDMLAIVKEKYPGVVLVLAGDTPDVAHRNWLLEQAKQNGLEDSLHWTGWLPTQKAWDYVTQAHIALSPYPRGHLLDSASPTKVVEYMALGIPTVANDQPDQAYVLRSSGAGVYCQYTPEEFAKSVLSLLDSESLRKEMAAAGPKWVAEHRSYAKLAEDLSSRYTALLSRS